MVKHACSWGQTRVRAPWPPVDAVWTSRLSAHEISTEMAAAGGEGRRVVLEQRLPSAKFHDVLQGAPVPDSTASDLSVSSAVFISVRGRWGHSWGHSDDMNRILQPSEGADDMTTALQAPQPPGTWCLRQGEGFSSGCSPPSTEGFRWRASRRPPHVVVVRPCPPCLPSGRAAVTRLQHESSAIRVAESSCASRCCSSNAMCWWQGVNSIT